MKPYKIAGRHSGDGRYGVYACDTEKTWLGYVWKSKRGWFCWPTDHKGPYHTRRNAAWALWQAHKEGGGT